MIKKIGVAVVGFGNIGQYAVKALKGTGDMELKGVVEIKERLEDCRQQQPDVVFSEDITKLYSLCFPNSIIVDFFKIGG